MNPKFLLKILPVVLLMVVQLVGPSRVTEGVVQQPANQGQTINQLIEQLKSGDLETRSSAISALGKTGYHDDMGTDAAARIGVVVVRGGFHVRIFLV